MDREKQKNQTRDLKGVAVATKKTAVQPAITPEMVAQARAIISANRMQNPSTVRSNYGSNLALVAKPKLSEERLPRQARMILEVVRDLKGKCSVDNLLKPLTAKLIAAGYRQDGWRIYTFYRKRLIEQGYVTIA